MSVLLMVGTQKGAFLFRSDEDREHWAMEGPLHPGWNVFDLQLDVRTTPTLYAAVGHFIYGPTVQYSADMGKSWQIAEKNPTYAEDDSMKMNNIWCVVPGAPSQPDTLYAGVDEAGLFVSHDHGRTWNDLPGLSHHVTRKEWMPGAGGMCCHSVVLDKGNPNRLWAAISAVGVLRSDDAGASWAVKNSGLEIIVEAQETKEIGSCVHCLIQHPSDPNRLFQQNHRGVYASVDAGDTWQRIEDGLPSKFGFPIAISPQNPDTLFLCLMKSEELRFPSDGQLAVYRSTNAGRTWQSRPVSHDGGTWANVMRQAMATDSLPETGVYLGTTAGQLFHSRDNGDTWHAIPGTLPRINSVRVAVLD